LMDRLSRFKFPYPYYSRIDRLNRKVNPLPEMQDLPSIQEVENHG
jgi:hypothetical protein